MPTIRRRLSLPAPARAFLLDELKALGRGSPHTHQKNSGRLAVTFRPRRQGRDGLAAGLVPLEAFRLLALSCRWCRGYRGRPQRRIALASYRACLDPRDGGRIGFWLEEAHDAADPGVLIRPRPNGPAIRSAVALHQALEDADSGDLASGLRLPRFHLAFEPGREPSFDPGQAAGAEAAAVAIEGLRAWPAEFLAEALGDSCRGLAPTRAFASLAHLKGRWVRNPAFAVLRRHGLIARGPGYRAWRATVRRGDGRTLQDPRDGATVAGGLRRAIEEYAASGRGREEALLAEMDAACVAMGIRVPEGAAGVDFLAGLLDNPWWPAEVPYAAGIQVVGLGGRPGPATMAFSDGAADARLFDLGEAGRGRDRFEPADERAILELLRR